MLTITKNELVISCGRNSIKVCGGDNAMHKARYANSCTGLRPPMRKGRKVKIIAFGTSSSRHLPLPRLCCHSGRTSANPAKRMQRLWRVSLPHKWKVMGRLSSCCLLRASVPAGGEAQVANRNTCCLKSYWPSCMSSTYLAPSCTTICLISSMRESR